MAIKFEHIPDLSDSDPRLRLMSAWADINDVLGNEPITLHDAYEVQKQIELERKDPNLGNPTSYEEAIQAAPQALSESLKEFRKSAESMKDWPITYKIFKRSIGLISITGRDDNSGEETLEHLEVTGVKHGTWWPHDGLIEDAFVGPTTSKLGGLSVGLVIRDKDDENALYMHALNTIHHLRIYLPGEQYTLEDPGEYIRKLMGLDKDKG